MYAGTYVQHALQHCGPDAELVDSQHLNLDAIIDVLVTAHRAGGKDVARLCSGGDPSIYSAVAEQTRRSMPPGGCPGTSPRGGCPPMPRRRR